MSSKPQAGILNRPPDHSLHAAFILMTPDAASTADALERLRTLIQRETRSDLDDTTPASAKDQPSAESGELGFTDGYDRYHLTITTGFGIGAYEKLGTSPEQRPQDLIVIPWDKLSDAPQKLDNGDIVLQICSDSMYVAEHVVRRVEEELADVLSLAWTLPGHQRHNTRRGRVNRDEGRALIGFIDGTSNLNPRHSPDDSRLVFVNPDDVPSYPAAQPPTMPGQPSPYGGPQPPVFPVDLRHPPTREPEWCRNGTYMVIRGSVTDVSAWDDLALGDQEKRVGRFKVSGNALDQPDDPNTPIADPNFAGDPDGNTTPLTAHIRKCNPRSADDAARRIFRRGYPLITATTDGLQRGLVFVCFARTITTQFEFITRAWTANPDFPRPGAGTDRLRELEHVLCGGYFFVPPLTNGRHPWSWKLPS